MATYLTPGVYVKEVSSGAKPIEGVGTGTGGFVGVTERGPVGKAVLVTNWSQYTAAFGGHVPGYYTSYAVENFFTEGGSKCYVVRTVHFGDIAQRATKKSAAASHTTTDTITVTAASDGSWGNQLTVDIEDASLGDAVTHFKAIVKENGVLVETLDELTTDSQPKSDYVVMTILARPANTGMTPLALAGGLDGLEDATATPAWSLNVDDFKGDPSETALTGLHAFDPVDEVNLIAMPDMHGVADGILDSADGIKKGYAYCENRQDCFFIGETPQGLTPSDAKDFRMNNSIASSFGAIYYPWIEITSGGEVYTIPPSGAVMGLYSRTDRERGVHKAPAGITDGYIRSASGLEKLVTHGQQEILNPVGVNVIRSFPGAGICAWGARTMSSDAEWKYINVRRMFLFLEESIDEATQWVVFEPNSISLWGSVKRNIVAFLNRCWLDGMFFGATPEEAFFVKIDEENNPEATRDAGQLVIDIGVAPVKPAEFVIVRIFQKTKDAG